MSRPLAGVCISTAWLMFVVSFFLPATNAAAMSGARAGSILRGWQAFEASMLVLAGTIQQPIILMANPAILLFVAFPFMNVTMLFAPCVTFAGRWSAALALILVPSGLLPLCLPVAIRGDIFVGFFLWNISFFIMSAGCILATAASLSSIARKKQPTPKP